MENILQQNERGKLCSGCGICAAVCPRACLNIRENEAGELRPVLQHDRCVLCGKCTAVCPFGDQREIFQHQDAACFIGAASEYEGQGSSGGVATWFMSRLLERGIADACVCVQPRQVPDELFRYTVCRTVHDLKACQGSAYYPVTLYHVLEQLKKEPGSVAVVAVPCFVTAIQRLRAQSGFWREKIKIVTGLVCGHTPNKHLIDCLAWSAGHERRDIQACRFRIHAENRPAWDYGVRLVFQDGTERTSFGSDDFGFLFWRRLFAQSCCNSCQDVFAEEADITFMDAWLPEYRELKTGTSMILCRTGGCGSILSELEKTGEIRRISSDKAIEAQSSLVEYKKHAGQHPKENRLAEKVNRLCAQYPQDRNIIQRVRRLCYLEKLKETNPLLWSAITLKDKVLGK